MSKAVAVLCGGLGTRLGLSSQQKCLVDIEGRPLLHWKLDQLARNGATEFHLLVAYRAFDVFHAIGSQWDGLPVSYYADDGIGQWKAHDRAIDRGLPFVHYVTYGDSLLDVELKNSMFPYVYVNDEHPKDAGVMFTWGKAKRFIPKHTAARAHHVNTPEDLEECRAFVRRHCVARRD